MAFAMAESAAPVVRSEDLALTSIPDVAPTSPAALEGRAAPPGPSAVDGAGTPPNFASVPGDRESGRDSDVAHELSVPSEPAASSDEPASGSAVQPEIANGGVTLDLPKRAEEAVSSAQVPAEVSPLQRQRRGSNRIPGWIMGAVAAAVVVAVGGGAFAAYYEFFRSTPQSTAAAGSAPAGSAAPQASGNPGVAGITSAAPSSSPIEMVPVAPPASAVASAAVAPVTSAQAQAVVPSPIAPANPVSSAALAQLPESGAVAQPPPSVTRPAVPPAPPVSPRRTVARAPAAQPVDHSLDVASKLVSKGEAAFNRQDYSTAIANANAALEVHPGYSRAERLLREARTAQRQAMNSITIH